MQRIPVDEEVPKPWTLYASVEPDARRRLYCLPYAGGGASTYRLWPQALAATGTEVWPIQPPGRENRMMEAPYDDLVALVERLIGVLGPHLHRRRYAVFGHSLGARLAYEFARQACHRSLPAPRHLIVSASRPPHRPGPEAPIHTLPDEEFLEQVKVYNGGLRIACQDAELLALVLPGLRADFAMAERSCLVPDDSLECDILALGGRSDPWVPPEELARWGDLTTGSCQVQLFDGDHFYLTADRGPVMATLAELLARV